MSNVPGAPTVPLRPPAVPLVLSDPYFSVWSMSDRLTDDWPRHWTGSNQGMCGMVRIDGAPYRFMGCAPAGVPALEQTGLEVLPLRTVYTFESAGIRLTLAFMSPLLPHDPEIMSRPVSYLVWEVAATDGRTHEVTLYVDFTAEIAVDRPDQPVQWGRIQVEGLDVMRVGSDVQAVLGRAGDNLRIEWGHFYLASPREFSAGTLIAGHGVREEFARSGWLRPTDDTRMPRAAADDWPVLALAYNLGPVDATPVSWYAMAAYDDVYSIEYMRRRLQPYWRRNGMDAAGLLIAAKRDFEVLRAQCEAYDAELMGDLRAAGGEEFARLAALAFRQCIAAHKLAADFDGAPMMFSKENFSNGCIGTVDLTYPSSPFFLLFNVSLLKAMLSPVLDYANSARWKHPFAPHDLGTYPLANGQVYGGGEWGEENQMPVEECGNMLVMMAAVARVEKSPAFALKYWPLLETWARYLLDKGLDPENQLCTDDFAGHLAHNANLSVKAIVALGGFATLCDMAGRQDLSAEFWPAARNMADEWMRKADDGDHYRLTFDGPGTWSQKYNMVWDSLLGLGLFPAEAPRREAAYCRRMMNRYGLPLDSRCAYTKLDWTVWTACLAESRADFEAFIRPLYAFAHETPTRVPLSDWFWTTDGRQAGFQARSVVGGVFLPMLCQPGLWEKWSARGAAQGRQQ